jgi:hypothetical protein
VKFYEGHFHDFLNDIDNEKVIADRSVTAARMSGR